MDAFTEFLRENRDRKTVTITPGGNHGDTLIHMGLVKKLDENGYDYTSLNLEHMYRGNPVIGGKYLINILFWRLGIDAGFRLLNVPEDVGLILFEGGGYMNDVWYGPALLKAVMRQTEAPIAVGPQSYVFARTRIADYFMDGREATLFCRERHSYDHLTGQGLPPTVQLKVSPELALYLAPEDLGEFTEPREESYQLVAMRLDRESAVSEKLLREIEGACDNPVTRDISMEGSLTDFVSWVANAETVYTDRLHVAIVSSILGKDVTLYGNRYHKNRGVWEYSLRDSVRFVEA
jgi:exopolysaccharide biosynthesis predicted pyruvyltransferase EpsI